MTVPHIKSAWQRVVAYVDEPRAHRVAYLTLYGFVLVAGFQAMFNPPRTLVAELGSGGVFGIGVTLAAGAILGAAFALRTWWYWERIGIILSCAGILIYASSIIYLHYAQEGNRLFNASLLLALVVSLVVRYLELVREEKLANKIHALTN